MNRHEFDHAQEAFAFAERLDALHSPDEIIGELEKALSRFGFEHFIFSGLPDRDQTVEKIVFAHNWPKAWFDLYVRENYIAVDPVARWSRHSAEPFEWSEAPYDRDAEPRACEVMTRAADVRMANGYCIPIRNAGEQQACLSMSGVDLDLSPRTHTAIRLMGTYAFERIRQLSALPVEPRRDPLTEREREVLTWTALGKTSSEVAKVLKLSKRTVDEYSVRAARKLRAQNKTHAVVVALQQKLISL
jgi:LuxR family quorum sensing-dependent transcriptional regulator